MNGSIIQGALTTAIACGMLSGAASAQQTAPDLPGAVRVTWDERPSIRFGRVARVDIRLTLQMDGRDSEVPVDPNESRASWARKRVGVDGVVAGLFGFQIEHDLGANGQWRDVYVNYQQFDAVQVQAGQFKLPFSRERTTSPARIDFVYRSRVAETLAPGRDRGVMVHGRVVRNRLEYELGLFEHDGNERRSNADRVYGGRSVAARLTARPFRTVRSAARTLEVGAAGVWSDVSLGLTSLKGETPFDREFYDPDFWVLGAQRRQGVEFRWRPGPFSVKSEYIRLTTERRNQSVEDTDLSPFLADGWYVSGTWVLTGERKAAAGPENPRRPLPRGPGAIEAAVRLEAIKFSSTAPDKNDDDEPSSSPRADVLRGNRLRALTLGVNWVPIRWVKLQFNVIRESLDDPSQGPLPGKTSFWDRVVRVQFYW